LVVENLADLAVADRKVSLPFRVARVLLDEVLADGEIGAEFGEGGGEVALVAEYLADPLMADRKVSLPPCVARILLDETLSDFEIGAVFSEGGGEVALVAEHVADLPMADRKVALPFPVTRVLLGHPLLRLPGGDIQQDRTPDPAAPTRTHFAGVVTCSEPAPGGPGS